uniref:Uncharacterized protein n=1 Tax=Cacopsylla melanoneura TaxID=428564 RepID=A0A8D9ABW1_9HEMI
MVSSLFIATINVLLASLLVVVLVLEDVLVWEAIELSSLSDVATCSSALVFRSSSAVAGTVLASLPVAATVLASLPVAATVLASLSVAAIVLASLTIPTAVLSFLFDFLPS